MKEIVTVWFKALSEDCKELVFDIKSLQNNKKWLGIIIGMIVFIISCFVYKSLFPLILTVLFLSACTIIISGFSIGLSVAVVYFLTQLDCLITSNQRYPILRQTISIILSSIAGIWVLTSLQDWFGILDIWKDVSWYRFFE